MTVPIATRKSWGARHDDGDQTLSGLALEVFAHHSVTTQLRPDATVEQERAQMRAIESIGESRFGTGISYNVLIFPSGRAYQGVSWNRRGTHTGGRNSTARSICFAGNYEANRPTEAQIATAAAIYAEGQGKWWVRRAPLFGHRNVKSTACPGKYVYNRLDDIKAGPVSAARPVVILGPGTKHHEDVEILQEYLNRRVWLAPKLVVDGDYGEKTSAAVRGFQMREGLDRTGNVNVVTRDALVEAGLDW
jgi:hypothetical protein